MVFSSAVFLSAFLPLTLGGCVLLRRHIRWQNAALLLLSLLFYAWGEARHLPLLLLSALGNAAL
ncbi:MAG: MBOAT family protein, partial [Clostridia bacterium]|nr:MBOAT family protein [Clostridia bacterium]